ncbi:3924_t:CDS:2, partial [Acaulospora colombiana]
MPELRMVNFFSAEPRSSGGTCGPSIMTDKTIINIPTRAKPDARASLEMSRYKDRGKDGSYNMRPRSREDNNEMDYLRMQTKIERVKRQFALPAQN